MAINDVSAEYAGGTTVTEERRMKYSQSHYRSLDHAPEILRSLVAQHGAICEGGEGKLLKKSSRRSVTLIETEIDGESVPVIVKEFRYPFFQRIRKLFWLHRGLQAWRGTHIFRRNNFRAPVPLALIEERTCGLVSRCYLIYQFEEGLPLDRFLAQHFGGRTSRESLRAKRCLLRELALDLRRQHDIGIFNRDVKAENVIVNQEGDRYLFTYIDLEGVSMPLKLLWEFRARNLAQLNSSLSAPLSLGDRLFFFYTYLAGDDVARPRLKRMAARVMTLTRERRHIWPINYTGSNPERV